MATHTAVITGSTAGLGSSFARQLAAQGYDLVLVARDGERLGAQAESLTAQYGVVATVLQADLVTDDGVAAVQERLSDPRNPVHLLVNNAGHGLSSDFLESDLDDERDLLRLHVQTTMELTHTAARAMSRRRGGRIINVASVAGFTPTGTYSAAKSWVINFTKALHQQVRPQGVIVTALCPGLVRTEFHDRSGIRVTGAKRWMWLDADDVVREGLAANAQGTAVSVPSRSYQVLTTSLKFVPDSMVRWAMERRAGASNDAEPLPELEAETGPRPAGAALTGDGTAEPTTEAIRTVDAYKAARADEANTSVARTGEVEAGEAGDGPGSSPQTGSDSMHPESADSDSADSESVDSDSAGQLQLNGRNPLNK